MKIINWLKKVVAHPYWRSSSVTPLFVVMIAMTMVTVWFSLDAFIAAYITALNVLILAYDWLVFQYKGDVAKKQQQIDELFDEIDRLEETLASRVAPPPQ